MDPEYFGTEKVTAEDRAYRGSRFSEVRDALFANPYQKVWGGGNEPELPVYSVNLTGVLRGVLFHQEFDAAVLAFLRGHLP
jgi:hypothetical protein